MNWEFAQGFVLGGLIFTWLTYLWGRTVRQFAIAGAFNEGVTFGRNIAQPVKFRAAPGCVAVQHSDNMVCLACELSWGVNDPQPPICTKLYVSLQKEHRRQRALAKYDIPFKYDA